MAFRDSGTAIRPGMEHWQSQCTHRQLRRTAHGVCLLHRTGVARDSHRSRMIVQCDLAPRERPRQPSNVPQADRPPSHGLASRPGNGPFDHDHSGHRVFAVFIVLSLFT
jgi:hypothetical protein